MSASLWLIVFGYALIFGHAYAKECNGTPERKLYYGVDCERNCTLHPEPRSCYYNFTIELYTTNNIACDYCETNATNYVTNDCECIRADGAERSLVCANRMLPGPAIYVCLGDKIIVDVKNVIQGEDITIHWHGIEQKGTQYYDGVPFVTQCPISEDDTFRYQFYANKSGTYYWHSHVGLSRENGVEGSLVIKESRATDVQAKYFDYDLWEHTIIVSDWLHYMAEDIYPGRTHSHSGQNPQNLLINGKGQYTDNHNKTSNTTLAVFKVKQGLRYRFRLINGFAGECAGQLVFQNHTFLLIAMDGKNIEPVHGNSIISMTGERYDFVITADQPIGSYWIQLVGMCDGADIVQQLAILEYEGASENSLKSNPKPTLQNQLQHIVTINPLDGNCTYPRADAYCLNHINDSTSDPDLRDVLYTADEEVLRYYVPVSIYHIQNLPEFYSPGTYSAFLIGGTVPDYNFGLVNTMSYVAAPSTLLSQYYDNSPDTYCDYAKCWNASEPCICTNVVKIPLGVVIDLIVVDTTFNITGLYHPMHLHGQSFYVLAMGLARDLNVDKIGVEVVKEAYENGKIPCRTHGFNGYPPRKDTISLPVNGFAIIRFKTENPGFWLLHCHIDYHIAVGMEMVWQVGELSDMPPVPAGFPTCGNFLPDLDID